MAGEGHSYCILKSQKTLGFCKTLDFTFYPIVSQIIYKRDFLSMSLNLKMTVERSKVLFISYCLFL